MQRLCELNIGDEAIVVKLCNQGTIRRRLMELGLIENTKIKCVMISPIGDPKAYKIRGAVIAIRNEDAMHIAVNIC